MAQVDLEELAGLSQEQLVERAQKDPIWFEEACRLIGQAAEQDRQENQLAYYRLVNPMALRVHLSTAREVDIVGGNRSSKTDTTLAELGIQTTGVVPESLRAVYPREKLRAPIRARVVCNSLTDTLEPVIKPKLRYDQWNGVAAPSTGKGHWGWIPRRLLKGGSWESAFSAQNRTLHVSVDSTWVGNDGMVNSSRSWSSVQFMSYDQDLSTFAGSSMHFIMHDELPPADIYRENRLRTLDVQGQIYTAFTPPDEAGIQVGDVTWFFDDVYERGLPGPGKAKDIETIILHTERNELLDEQAIADLASKMTDAQREVRLRGKFIHLSGVIYGLFSRTENWWCYRCQRKVFPVGGTCPHCTGDDIGEFCHVVDPFPIPSGWPVLFVVDPHPRKPDAIGWFAITPSDDLVWIGELEVEGTADDIASAVRDFESRNRINPVKRLMDPNMATETNDKLKRGWTIRKAYDDAGLRCDLANDEMASGINEVREYLKPDSKTRRPRLTVFSTNERAIYGMTHWTWDEHRAGGDRELKEMPRDRHKDFPDLVRYAVMDRPSFRGYTRGAAMISRPRGQRGPRGY